MSTQSDEPDELEDAQRDDSPDTNKVNQDDDTSAAGTDDGINGSKTPAGDTGASDVSGDPTATDYWLLSGLRTPFCKVDGGIADRNAIELSIPVVQEMVQQVQDGPDAAVWGEVAPILKYSNIAREIWIDAGLDQSIPSISTQMACATSMAAVFDATGLLSGDRSVALCGGVESMSNIQVGMSTEFSNWLRRLTQSSGTGEMLATLASPRLPKLDIPGVENRSTGMSMGEHCEEMVKEWDISRERQDEIALASHENAVDGQENGFFDDLVMEVDGVETDAFPRPSTTMDALSGLPAVFDSDEGTISPGNSSPLTDGAAGVWLSTEDGLDRFDDSRPRVKLVDWEIAGVDIFEEGLLMAPAYAIPRLLDRHDMKYDDIDIWEIHEAFAAQIACHIDALESDSFLENKVGIEPTFGDFPRDRMNPNGGSVALGHPFGATGARILS
ncbi:MAG: acetyl-CoA C-acyltransferase, partial [bacterium]